MMGVLMGVLMGGVEARGRGRKRVVKQAAEWVGVVVLSQLAGLTG